MFPYSLHVGRKERHFGAVSLLLTLHHILSQKEKVKMLVAYLCLTLCDHGLWPSRLLCPQDSPGKNTGVGCHSLL